MKGGVAKVLLSLEVGRSQKWFSNETRGRSFEATLAKFFLHICKKRGQRSAINALVAKVQVTVTLSILSH
jgi:hypothetical protein